MDGKEREKAIRELVRNSNLSSEELSREISALMMRGTRTGQTVSESEETQVSGCEHYQRKCNIVAKCCGKEFACRLCHDEKSDHVIDRFATEEMICRDCRLRQPVGPRCQSASCTFDRTHYFCPICKLWVDDVSKNIFHCEKCKICRVGKQEEYAHCDRCNLCWAAGESHTCTNSDTNCCVCGEDLHSSVNHVTALRCGHGLHLKCFKSAIKHGIVSCPYCRKSFEGPETYDLEVFRQQLETNEMPPEFRGWTAIISCNDCNQSGSVPFHFVGHMCSNCNSLNTVCLSRHAPTNASEELEEDGNGGEE